MKRVFAARGAADLELVDQCSKGYSSPQQRQEVIAWLQGKNYWKLEELQHHNEY